MKEGPSNEFLPPPARKVSVEDPLYRKERDISRLVSKDVPPAHQMIGSSALSASRAARVLSHDRNLRQLLGPEAVKQAKDRLKEELLQVRADLTKAAERRPRFFQIATRAIMQTPQFASIETKDSQFADWLRSTMLGTWWRRGHAPFSKKGAVRDESILLFLEAHANTLKRNQEWLDALTPRVTAQFVEQFKAFQERAGIDFQLDEETIKKRLVESAVMISDGLTSQMEKIGGYYSHDRNLVMVVGSSETWVRHVLTHEFMHALSGRLIMGRVYREHGNDEEYTELNLDLRQDRIGLRYHTGEKQQFKWLNEGVTELLTVQMIQEETGIYKEERALLREFLSGGSQVIDPTLLFNAYFENYEPGNENPNPHWKKFRKAVNDAYSPEFLVALDTLVTKEGVGKALEVLKEGWQAVGMASKKKADKD